MTTLRKSTHEGGFTTVPNSLIVNPDLDLGAKALVIYALSKPDGWRFSTERIVRETGDGLAAVRSAVARAEAAGYVQRRKVFGGHGRILHTWDVRASLDLPWPDRSAEIERFDGENGGLAIVEKQIVDVPNVEKPVPLVRKRNKERVSKTESKRPLASNRRDELFEAVMAVCGVDWQAGIPNSARGAYNRAVSDLRQLDVDPSSVAARADVFRRRWPDASLTPTALSRRWAECDPASRAARPAMAASVNLTLAEVQRRKDRT